MVVIRNAKQTDLSFWLSLDRHIAESLLQKKIERQERYIAEDNNGNVGLLRYKLFLPACRAVAVGEDGDHVVFDLQHAALPAQIVRSQHFFIWYLAIWRNFR